MSSSLGNWVGAFLSSQYNKPLGLHPCLGNKHIWREIQWLRVNRLGFVYVYYNLGSLSRNTLLMMVISVGESSLNADSGEPSPAPPPIFPCD